MNIAKSSILTLCLVILILLLLGPRTERAEGQGLFKLSERQEIALGQQVAMNVERRTPMMNDLMVEGYINRLGQFLVRYSRRSNIPYYFRVTNLSDINAFALPGGFVYVNRGLIAVAENESELAGVMAHEISHVVARHAVGQIQRAQRLNIGLGLLGAVLGRGTAGNAGATGDLTRLGAELAASGVFMKYSRKAEKEADQLGARNMYDAGFDPRGMITFLEKLNQLRRRDPTRLEAFFSSHPSLSDRVENVSKTIRSQTRRSGLRRNSSEFDQVRFYLTGQHSRDTWQNQPPMDTYPAPGRTRSRVRKF